MTEDLNVFPNSNAPLFGAGEDSEGIIVTPAVAGLTGSLVLAEDLDQGNTAIPATTTSTTNQQPRRRTGIDQNVVITFSNITTPDDSNLIIIFASATFLANTNSTKNWKFVRDGTTTLDTFTQQASHGTQTQANLRVFVDENPPAGSHTYTIVENNGNTYGGIIGNLFFVVATDTHAGFIQSVAVPGKQINVADSHTTRELAVLPA